MESQLDPAGELLQEVPWLENINFVCFMFELGR